VNKDVAVGIAAALDQLDADENTHVVILTGAGGTFCSGMDLKAFVTGETPYVEGRGFAGMVQRSTDKPLIAAVEGYALAGGCELAITCDLIVAADNSKFGIPEVKRGLAAAAGGLVRLPRQIPSRVAMEMALTGDFMDADRALSLGLINQVAPAGSSQSFGRKDSGKWSTCSETE
jgi:enoyl-CoA hydratase